MVVNLIRNINEINLKGIFLVLAHGNMAHLKKRSNVRYMRQFAIKGIDTLNEEKDSINDERTFNVLCVKYYEYSVRYCLNKQDREELHNKFKSALGIDIVELAENMSPLGFRFKFTDDLPTEDKRKKIEKAIKEDDENIENEEEPVLEENKEQNNLKNE